MEEEDVVKLLTPKNPYNPDGINKGLRLKLTILYNKLDTLGIHHLENFSCCSVCGHDELKDKYPEHVFFTSQAADILMTTEKIVYLCWSLTKEHEKILRTFISDTFIGTWGPDTVNEEGEILHCKIHIG